MNERSERTKTIDLITDMLHQANDRELNLVCRILLRMLSGKVVTE